MIGNLGYYFDTLPIHPRPVGLESLVSYLIRLAEANSILWPGAFDAILGQAANTTIAGWSDYPRSLESLQKITFCPINLLMQTTFYHLLRKFGRLAGANGSQGLLWGSVHRRSLRYCPLCLSEHPHYPLTWRFSALRGCHIHACKILERCGHCASIVSGSASPLRMAWCQKCRRDLRDCTVEPLTTEEHHEAIRQFLELEFLLSPQPWEEYHATLPEMLGQAFALLRRAKGVTHKSITEQTGLSATILTRLEHYSSASHRAVSFQSYTAYAAYLGTSLREVFSLALKIGTGDGPQATSKTNRAFSENELVERIRHAVDALRASGQRVTRKNIYEVVSIGRTSACLRSPRVQELLNQIDAEVHDEGKRRQVRDSEEMLEKVQKAIQLLEGRQELVTYQSVSQIVGIPSQRFAYYPQAQTLLKRHAQYQNQMTQRVRLREDEIVAGVQRAIQQLEENQQRVTMNAVCRIVGISPSCFTTYPCIKALLDQRADHRSRIQLEKAIQRENELFLHVEEAIRELRSLNRQVTQKAIAALVGMQPNSMKQYPRVRSVLAENAGVYHHNTRTHSQEREGELVARVAAAKDLLESSGQVVTQRAIARMVGLGPRSFMRYPKVRMLIPPQKNISRLRSVQASPAEDKLIFDVEKAMQQLDAQGLTVTMPRVSASLGISPMMLLRYPRVLSSVKEVAKDQARKRYEQREDELVQTAYTTIQRLRELGHPINFTAVAKAMQRSASSLRYYPKIRSLVEQIRRENEPCI